MTTSRYIVGIDLGTTNCVVAYVDTQTADLEQPEIKLLRIPQLVTPGNAEERDTLPSFLYLPTGHEFPAGSLTLPWADDLSFAVGALARTRGAEAPGRLISSSKSWLCHVGVDRTAPILPWGGGDDLKKMSPLEVSSQYLVHIRNAWSYLVAQGEPTLFLENQDILLTVPASFDAAARELTVQAAERAGLPSIRLLEEPQAAFYAWIHGAGERWRKQVKVGDIILVCDIGGGTTDFTLISVSDEGGELELKRVAVGEHILLGGDNMDLALAYAVQQRLAAKGTKLDAWQLRGLSQNCRAAKETLLQADAPKSQPLAILGRGSSVIGGAIRTELAYQELETTLVDGFFPRCESSDLPKSGRRVGFQEMGLPYAADPAVTRHLAKFLTRQRTAELTSQSFVHPTALLFNGGVMKADLLRQRVVEVLNGWLDQEDSPALRTLAGTDLDHAVACGAAYYGLARRGKGVRIRGGAARSYYIGIETSMPAVPGVRAPLKALCVVPFGMEEGTESDIPGQEFGLVVGEPAEFRFLGSTTRREDHVGQLIEEPGDDIDELSPVEAALSWIGQEGVTIPVRLHTHVTEVGTLELWAVSRDETHRWKLEFNVRTSGDDEQ
ncbi:MAG: Hsp70 family protein [Deltaproteobacteria bacterium]|nr:Hsp70 family protein [Deltaproteobacteria bacterium]